MRTVHGMTTSAEVGVHLDEHGGVIEAHVGSGVPPSFPICDKPTLATTDPKVLAHVIGTELGYSDWHGPQTAGKVTKADVRRVIVELDELDDQIPSRPMEFVRGISVYVTRNGLSWRFVVDGETGAVLGTIQLFDF
jgi:hypothetical protein